MVCFMLLIHVSSKLVQILGNRWQLQCFWLLLRLVFSSALSCEPSFLVKCLSHCHSRPSILKPFTQLIDLEVCMRRSALCGLGVHLNFLLFWKLLKSTEFVVGLCKYAAYSLDFAQIEGEPNLADQYYSVLFCSKHGP